MMARDKFPMGGAALLRGLDFGRRGSAALPLLAAMSLLAASGAVAATTNDLSEVEIQGRNLVQQLLEQSPATNFAQSGILKIRDAKGITTNIPVFFRILVTTGYWQTRYVAMQTNYDSAPPSVQLVIIHRNGEPNEYDISEDKGGIGRREDIIPIRHLHGNQIMASFAGSDFWVADLGLEFFHWPEQKILKHEMRRGRACKVLESTNPDLSSPNIVPPICYSRVVSWIDNESGGIVQAEAYDFKNRLLKEFAPKSFKKVNGQWELQEMEIRNVQTGSRTRLEFDLKKE